MSAEIKSVSNSSNLGSINASRGSDNQIKVVKPHTIEISGRKKAMVTGVNEVIGISEGAVILDTSEGGLVLSGKGIRVNRFNKDEGALVLDGEFAGLKYTEKQDTRGLFAKLFK